MAFSHVPLRRSVPAGVVAYLAGYVAAFALVGSRTATLLGSVHVDGPYGETEPLPALVDPVIPTWKFVGWVVHSAHGAKLVAPFPDYGATLTLNVVARVGGEYRLLYLVPPAVLAVAGYLVARTSRTYGARGEQFAGASVALGYLPCCVAGALLFSVGRPTIAPALSTSILYAGIGYPVVFGWLGGLAARRHAERDPETASLGGEAD